MRHIRIDEATFERSRYLREHHPHRLVRRRAHMIYLLYKDYDHKQIADILDISAKTVTDWVRIGAQEGVEALYTLHYEGRPSELRQHKEQLKQSLISESVQTIAQAAQVIKDTTGIERCVTQVRHFVVSILGLRRRKTEQVSAGKYDVGELAERQRKFVSEELQPRIEAALRAETMLVFCDAVHPVYGSFAHYTYGDKALAVRSGHGRYRVNLYSALDISDLHVYTQQADQYVNRFTVQSLMDLLKTHAAGRRICMVMDNASYQTCYEVKAHAAFHDIELLYLPPYSPNLNLIERVWKHMKKWLGGRHYESAKAFEQQIMAYVKAISQGEFIEQFKPLLTLKFPIVDRYLNKCTFLPV